MWDSESDSNRKRCAKMFQASGNPGHEVVSKESSSSCDPNGTGNLAEELDV
jgi:hypothetical protein